MKVQLNSDKRDILRQLQIGQSIFLVTNNAWEIRPEEICLREYGVARLPTPGGTGTIVGENGKMYSLRLFTEERDFCIGTAAFGKRRYYGFLSEQDFWDWWDYRRLSMLLPQKIGMLALAQPTVENLQLFRNILDLMEHRHYRFQNISCKGCTARKLSRCAGCVRSKKLRDYWAGDGQKEPSPLA